MAVAPSSGKRWTGGLKDVHLDCPVSVLWDFVADWAHWDRFYPSNPDFPMVSELREGENRKVGCLRYTKLAPETWTNERLLALDHAKHYFSYNMEQNTFCGGLRNYVAKVQFRGTDDGKTVLEYWSFEVDPLTTMTREDCTKFITGFLSVKLVSGMEAASKKIAAERWSGGIQPRTMDCSLDTVWDLITDWGRWDRFYPQDPSPAYQVSSRLEEGENGKLGCVRYGDLALNTYSYERLITIDKDKHYLSYNMEDNNLYGGLRNYVAKVQFSPTSDGKTKLEYWNFEVEPLTKTTWEDFSNFMQYLLGTKLATGLEATAKNLDASKPQTSAHHHVPSPPIRPQALAEDP